MMKRKDSRPMKKNAMMNTIINSIYMKIISKLLKLLLTVITITAVIAGSVIYFSIDWMFTEWSNITMDELVYHATADMEGTDAGIIMEYLGYAVAPAILLILTLIIVFVVWRRKKRYYLVMALSILLAVTTAYTSVQDAWRELEVDEYIENRNTESDFVEEYYVDPKEVYIQFPEEKRNLIYIFLESMEVTYTDEEEGGAFETNYIPRLTNLAVENEDFSGVDDDSLNGGYSMPGTTWTVAAMFAHTSGLPLVTNEIDRNDMDTQDNFYDGVTTLGDILEQEGYSRELMIGSDATFGGRRLLFTHHGNYDIFDYNYALTNGLIPEGYYVWWGYEDKRLFQFAKDELLELSEQEEPFALTLLTVDTHKENGYVCEACRDRYGDDQYANVIDCSDRQVSSFIKWLQRQDFYENTTIVIVGDHPTMDSDFCQDVDGDYTRKVYTTYINPAVNAVKSERREYTTFDSFPTVIAALGAEIEGDCLGLGTNLFSENRTLIEKFGIQTVERELMKKSEFLEGMINIDENSEKMLTRKKEKAVVTVAPGGYQPDTGLWPVSLEGLSYDGEEEVTLSIAVWQNEDQSDVRWYTAERDEQGNYTAWIHMGDYGYRFGGYNIHVYMEDSEGNEYLVGAIRGIVE